MPNQNGPVVVLPDFTDGDLLWFLAEVRAYLPEGAEGGPNDVGVWRTWSTSCLELLIDAHPRSPSYSIFSPQVCAALADKVAAYLAKRELHVTPVVRVAA